MLKIVTDGAADLPFEWQNEYEIDICPVNIQFGERTYLQDIELDKEGFYKLVDETRKIPKTSQPTPHQFLEVYKRIASPGDTILSIHVTSKLSGTYASAVAAGRSQCVADGTFIRRCGRIPGVAAAHSATCMVAGGDGLPSGFDRNAGAALHLVQRPFSQEFPGAPVALAEVDRCRSRTGIRVGRHSDWHRAASPALHMVVGPDRLGEDRPDVSPPLPGGRTGVVCRGILPDPRPGSSPKGPAGVLDHGHMHLPQLGEGSDSELHPRAGARMAGYIDGKCFVPDPLGLRLCRCGAPRT